MYFAPFLDLRGIGKSGIFMFFLLSSFLLTLPMLGKRKEIFTLPVMSHYWQRRFFRIYPLYTLYLLMAVASTWLMASRLGRVGEGIPFSLDWRDFFNHMTLQEGKGVTWSIAVEFKFYFILPFVVFAFASVRSRGLRITVLFSVLLLLLFHVISPASGSATSDPRLLPYMPIFIIGVLLAVMQHDINRKLPYAEHVKRACRYLGYVGVVGIVVMTPLVFSRLVNSIPSDHFHKQFILYSLLWSFVLLSAVNVRGVLQRFFSLPILRFYGALSFSLYLFHPIFIRLVQSLEANRYLGAWLVLLASTVSSYVSFRLLEGPVSKFKVTRNLLSSLFARRDRAG